MKVNFWLGEEDYVLIAWLDAPENKNKCLLIAKAIEYYNEHNSYLCIGKINLEKHVIRCKNRSLTIKAESKAEEWYKKYSLSNKRGATTKVKEILTHSIIVTDNEEYFPRKYDTLESIETVRKENIDIKDSTLQYVNVKKERNNVKNTKKKNNNNSNDYMDDAITKMLGNGQNSMFKFG